MFACLLANDYGVDMNGHVRHEPLINLLLLGPVLIPDLPCQQLSPWPRFLTDSSIYVNPWIRAQGLFFSPLFLTLCQDGNNERLSSEHAGGCSATLSDIST